MTILPPSHNKVTTCTSTNSPKWKQPQTQKRIQDPHDGGLSNRREHKRTESKEEQHLKKEKTTIAINQEPSKEKTKMRN